MLAEVFDHRSTDGRRHRLMAVQYHYDDSAMEIVVRRNHPFFDVALPGMSEMMASRIACSNDRTYRTAIFEIKER